ncbi:MAG: hypothetical protein GBAus27B_000547 [Mycoplasmataceae bacterium]|nr:MAG: hypothetical protein GBAus27B_000547 [Mycoplasmataceae bacterium]
MLATHLTEAEFLKQLHNPEKIKELNISNNNFQAETLDFLKPMTNLEWLDLGSYDEKWLGEGLINRFYGSLEPLKNMSKLNYFNIANTDINSGLEYLPKNIESFYCSSWLRKDAKCQQICRFIGNKEWMLEVIKDERRRDFWEWVCQIYKNGMRENKPLENYSSSISFGNSHLVTEAFRERNWEYWGFSQEETKEWIEVGLKDNEYQLAGYLKANSFTPEQYVNFSSKNSQEYLDYFAPLKKRDKTIELNIRERNLTGSLKLVNFPNLKKFDCSKNQISKLEIINCPQLSQVTCSKNQLSDLNFLNDLNPKNITLLSVSENKFPAQDLSCFSHFKNLEFLHVENNSFYGSLECLKGLKKVKILGIEKTNVSQDWEYLDKTKEILLFSNYRNKELDDYKSGRGSSSYDLQLWRKDQPGFKELQEILNKINPDLNINDLMEKVFFNSKTGAFEGDLQGINYLLNVGKPLLENKEKEINTLINIIQSQKKKIVEAYLHFAPEKELLQKTIEVYLEYIKSKLSKGEDNEETIELWKQKRKIQSKLEDKITKPSLIMKIEDMLRDCDKLAENELELKNKHGLTIEFKEGKIIFIGNNNIINSGKYSGIANYGNIGVVGDKGQGTITQIQSEEQREVVIEQLDFSQKN